MTEDQVIAGCRRREREAQRELYARTSERIYRLLLRLTQDPQTAADLMQETYIRAFEHIDGFHGASSLGTWVYRIAINEAGQYFRRRGRYERALREDFPRPAETDPGGQEAAAIRLDVREALALLPEEERTLIILKYFEGLDYARMAELLDKPPGTIASGLNRARGMLQDLLEDKKAESREDAPAGRHPMGGKSR